MLNPSGLCQCGCGQPAPIANRTSTARGYVKGEPMRFLVGHQRKLKTEWTEQPGPLSTPCWIWAGKPDAKGYGHIVVNGRKRKAHVHVWEKFHGPVPAGKVLDHLCRVRNCVRPTHLEPITEAQNALRGESPWAINARKTQCKQGHEFTTKNTVMDADGHRRCRECIRLWNRETQRQIRADAKRFREGK